METNTTNKMLGWTLIFIGFTLVFVAYQLITAINGALARGLPDNYISYLANSGTRAVLHLIAGILSLLTGYRKIKGI